MTQTHRPLHQIADDIRSDYASRDKSVHWSAKPYVDAMRYLDRITDNYGMDTGRDVVIYALSNLTSWRGEVARSVKAELKAMLK